MLCLLRKSLFRLYECFIQYVFMWVHFTCICISVSYVINVFRTSLYECFICIFHKYMCVNVFFTFLYELFPYMWVFSSMDACVKVSHVNAYVFHMCLCNKNKIFPKGPLIIYCMYVCEVIFIRFRFTLTSILKRVESLISVFENWESPAKLYSTHWKWFSSHTQRK